MNTQANIFWLVATLWLGATANAAPFEGLAPDCRLQLEALRHDTRSREAFVSPLLWSRGNLATVLTAKRVIATGRLDSGSQNAGIFRTSLPDGKRVLIKLSYATAIDRKGTEEEGTPSATAVLKYLWIHHALGEAGGAPRLFGFLPPNEARELVGELRKLGYKIDKVPVVGVVMEEMPQAWNISRSASSPAYLKAWPLEDLIRALERISELERMLNQARIYHSDAQILFSQSAEEKFPRIVLGDLDSANLLGDSQVNDFSEIRYMLVAKWQRATRTRLPNARLQELVGQMVPHGH